MMRLLVSLCALLLILPAALAEDDHPSPFDDNYAAMPVVDTALDEARASGKRLLLVFGANWCHDSRGLAAHFHDEALAAILTEHYVTRFIDVGWRDRNHDVMRRFGVAAFYATPMVMVIDPVSETLLNRDQRGAWGSAASTPVEEARHYFSYWGRDILPGGGVAESSLIYQAMLLEIDVFEDEEGARLAAAYVDIGAWRAAPAADRPAEFAALAQEVEDWRRELPRQLTELRSQALSQVLLALGELAVDGTITSETVAALDRQDPDIPLDFRRHISERW